MTKNRKLLDSWIKLNKHLYAKKFEEGFFGIVSVSGYKLSFYFKAPFLKRAVSIGHTHINYTPQKFNIVKFGEYEYLFGKENLTRISMSEEKDSSIFI